MSVSGITDAVNIVHEFSKGSLSAEECFCMVLSVLGEEQTKLQFHNIVFKAGLPQNGLLWKQVHDVHTDYFASLTCEDFQTWEINPEEAESFGEKLDLELALALSVTEFSSARAKESSATDTVSSVCVPSYASKIKTPQNCVPSSLALTGRALERSEPLKLNGAVSNRNCLHQSDELISQEDGSETRHPAKSNQTNPEESTSKRKKKKKKAQSQYHGPGRHICNKPVVYWLRRDLRLYDNPALVAASESNAPVILTFLWNEGEEGPLAAGGATKYWLHFALSELNSAVQREYNNRIVFRKVVDSHRELLSLVAEVGAGSVVMNNLYEPCLTARDDKICAALQSQGVEVRRFDSYLLHQPDSVNTDSRGIRGIGSVTHFMDCCRRSSTQPIGLPVDKPSCLPASASMPQSQPLEELGLSRLPRRKDGTVIDWARVIRDSWDFSEDGAWTALELFVDGGIRNYEKESGRADMLNTSRISPYLHFGQVSPRAVLRHAQGLRSPKFLRKLAWRDLSYWLLTKFPDMPSTPMRVHYQKQRWSQNIAHLKAWQKGKTGYPLVDAAMRQLWLTGWMNNYMRHVVASFLISYLHLHWVHGYSWFQDTLLDADVAINAMMWQNGGMSGLDQWNFVMHPVDAALTCDPNGHYVRRWCPELSALPDDYIHKPWKCPPSILRRAVVELGQTYPHRIITDLEEAREQSLDDVVTIRLANPQFVDPHTGNDLVPLPSGLLLPVITRREFKYKTANPQAKDNPHTAVLRGYRSRKRDEKIAFANQVDFTASTVNECAMRHKRYEQFNQFVEL